ncbi:MAG: hypothetical protein K0R49_70 [Burkholderiales bacterium]|jgi:hypothetical protein|nr:hypothetical protein [Burkholderiales bacterium]
MQNKLNRYIFSSTGEVHHYQEQDNALIVTVLLCKVGTFTDANGTEVNLNKEQLQGLTNTYNQEVETEYQKIQANKKEPIGRIFLERLLRKKTPELLIDEVTLAPVTTEHTLHNSFVVGRVIGRLEFKDISDSYGEIWGRLFISTKEYVDKVKGGILNQISLAFYPDTNKLEEVSFTVYGAIDGAQIIKMSQHGIKPDKTLLASTIGELSKKLSAINNELIDIDSKLTMARNKRSLERSVLGLVQFGKIYPRDRDLLLVNLLNMSSDNDRNILLSTIKALPNAIDLRVYNRNKQAFKMEELVMSKDKTVLVQTAEEISNAVQESLKLSKNKDNDANHEPKPEPQLSKPEGDPGNDNPQFTKEHAAILSDMLKNGKNNDAIDYLNKFKDEANANEEIQQTALSANSAKPVDEQQLENEKVKQEELKMSVLSQISKLTDILQKLP